MKLVVALLLLCLASPVVACDLELIEGSGRNPNGDLAASAGLSVRGPIPLWWDQAPGVMVELHQMVKGKPACAWPTSPDGIPPELRAKICEGPAPFYQPCRDGSARCALRTTQVGWSRDGTRCIASTAIWIGRTPHP